MDVEGLRVEDFDSESVFGVNFTHSLEKDVGGDASLDRDRVIVLQRDGLVGGLIELIKHFVHLIAVVTGN